MIRAATQPWLTRRDPACHGPKPSEPPPAGWRISIRYNGTVDPKDPGELLFPSSPKANYHVEQRAIAKKDDVGWLQRVATYQRTVCQGGSERKIRDAPSMRGRVPSHMENKHRQRGRLLSNFPRYCLPTVPRRANQQGVRFWLESRDFDSPLLEPCLVQSTLDTLPA